MNGCLPKLKFKINKTLDPGNQANLGKAFSN